jgi:hypothetical protein
LESSIVAGVYFYAIVRLDGVAFRPLGVQSRAITVNGRSIVVPLTLAVAVRKTLIVPAYVRSDPKRAIFVPSI